MQCQESNLDRLIDGHPGRCASAVPLARGAVRRRLRSRPKRERDDVQVDAHNIRVQLQEQARQRSEQRVGSCRDIHTRDAHHAAVYGHMKVREVLGRSVSERASHSRVDRLR